MKKCKKCGKRIKNVYYWNKETYGVECWQKIAIPEIRAKEKRESKERLQAWNEQCRLLIEVLKVKDLSKIKNQFKLKFIPQLIQQFTENNRMSKKQYEIAYEWLNNKDHLMMIEMKKELGYYSDELDYLERKILYIPNKEFDAIQKQIELLKAPSYVKTWRKISEEDRFSDVRNWFNNLFELILKGQEPKETHTWFSWMRTYHNTASSRYIPDEVKRKLDNSLKQYG